MLYNDKKFFLILFFHSFCLINFAQSLTSYDEYQEQESKIKKINLKNIEEKKAFYKVLFSKKAKLKKTLAFSSGALGTILISYLGYKYWINSKTRTNSNEQNPSQAKYGNTNKQEKTKSFIKTDYYKKPNFKDTIKYSIHKGFKKGLVNSEITFFVLLTTYIFSEMLRPLKNEVSRFFSSNEREHLRRSSDCIFFNLNQLKNLFLLESKHCCIEETINNYNFFIINLENFLALTSVINDTKNNNINNYQIIKNEHNLIYKEINEFTNRFSFLCKNKNLHEIQLSENWDVFKKLNDHILRFINLFHTIIYEN